MGRGYGRWYVFDCSRLITAISSTGDPKSFAYTTSRDRWPSILENVIKDVEETMKTSTPEKVKEGKEIIAGVERLRGEVLNDAILEFYHSQIRLIQTVVE